MSKFRSSMETFERSVIRAEQLANDHLATRAPSGDMQQNLAEALTDASSAKSSKK